MSVATVEDLRARTEVRVWPVRVVPRGTPEEVAVSRQVAARAEVDEREVA